MDSLLQGADARHPRNGVSIDQNLATVNPFNILPGHDIFRRPHVKDPPMLKKNEAVTIFRCKV